MPCTWHSEKVENNWAVPTSADDQHPPAPQHTIPRKQYDNLVRSMSQLRRWREATIASFPWGLFTFSTSKYSPYIPLLRKHICHAGMLFSQEPGKDLHRMRDTEISHYLDRKRRAQHPLSVHLINARNVLNVPSLYPHAYILNLVKVGTMFSNQPPV